LYAPPDSTEPDDALLELPLGIGRGHRRVRQRLWRWRRADKPGPVQPRTESGDVAAEKDTSGRGGTLRIAMSAGNIQSRTSS
jgi:hypothetical protein